jgi:hypothetical protein
MAEEISKGREEDLTLIDSLEWGDHLIRQARPGEFRNPAGFYIYLVRESIKPPRYFVTTRQRTAREAEEVQEQGRRIKGLCLEQAYEKYVEDETSKYVREKITETELADLKTHKKKALRTQFKNMTSDQLDDLAGQAALTEIRRCVPVKNFDEFCRTLAGIEPVLNLAQQ